MYQNTSMVHQITVNDTFPMQVYGGELFQDLRYVLYTKDGEPITYQGGSMRLNMYVRQVLAIETIVLPNAISFFICLSLPLRAVLLRLS